MGSLSIKSDNRRLLYYNEVLLLKQNIPHVITSLRLVILPHLVYSINNQITLIAFALFLFAIGTDLVDGYVARKLNSNSKLGGYLDVSFDFVFIAGIYLNFVINGIYSPLILFIIFGFFTQFILSNFLLKQTTYDPIGKYYGSLLFGGIGLTLLFSNQITYDIVTYGIVISTLISLISRITYFIIGRNNK